MRPRPARPFSKASGSPSAWRWWTGPSMSATPTASSLFLIKRARGGSKARAESSSISSPVGIGPEACSRARTGETLCRRRLAQQYRGRRHGCGGGQGGHSRPGSRNRRKPHLRLRPAQSGRPRLRADHGCTLDRGQRARRPRRRGAARLSDLGAGRRLLRLALLLLGPDGRRSRAAGSRPGRDGDHAELRARRPHRLARSVLDAGRARCPAFPTAW